MVHILLRRRMDDRSIQARLKQAQEEQDIQGVLLCLDRVRVSPAISEALVEFFNKAKTRQWKSIELVYCQGHVDRVIEAILTSRDLTVDHLSIIGGNTGASAIGRGLAQNSNVVRTLKLEATLSEEAAFGFAEGLRDNCTLEGLDLSHCQFSKTYPLILADALGQNRGLCALNLSDCDLEDEDMAKLIQSLQVHPSLKKLSISLNYCQSAASVAIAKLLLSSESKLERLDMSEQLIGEEIALNIEPVVQALKQNTTLKSLDLCDNFMNGSQMVSILADALTCNSTLEELNLENDDIDDDGIRVMAKKMPHFQGLKILRLRNNLFGSGAAEHLLEALQSNTRIQILEIDDWIPCRVYTQLYAHLNRNGRDFMTPNRVPLSNWPIILEHAAGNSIQEDDKKLGIQPQDIVFQLLQGPALLER